jgi:hypothetical protein
VPVTKGVQMHDRLTIFLDAVNATINAAGGSSSVGNPDVRVTVTDYPRALTPEMPAQRGRNRPGPPVLRH